MSGSFLVCSLIGCNGVNVGLKWYIVQTYSGFENKVQKNLEESINVLGEGESFGKIIVPAEQVIELKKGEKKTSSRKFFPGYIMVQMDLNKKTWHIVMNIAKVTAFVGGEVNPTPVPEEEVERILNQMEEGVSRPKPKYRFEQGEEIKVIDGPFSNFQGVVEEVKSDKEKLKVLISIFGRLTPVELDFIQVNKI